jgi:hypothetical protein
VVPVARAHPGHAGGGEVLGELPGRLLVEWLAPGAAMGVAVMLAGRYDGANFGFRAARAEELPAGDLLAEHTFALEGTASRDGRSVRFTALLDLDPTATVVGAPFQHEVVPGRTPRLGLRLLPAAPHADSTDASTIWNQIDFFSLPGAQAGAASITAPDPAHNLLVRSLRSHAHYDVTHP